MCKILYFDVRDKEEKARKLMKTIICNLYINVIRIMRRGKASSTRHVANKEYVTNI